MAKPTRGWLAALRRLVRLEHATPGRHRKQPAPEARHNRNAEERCLIGDDEPPDDERR